MTKGETVLVGENLVLHHNGWTMILLTWRHDWYDMPHSIAVVYQSFSLEPDCWEL